MSPFKAGTIIVKFIVSNYLYSCCIYKPINTSTNKLLKLATLESQAVADYGN